jgi:hypothetical protein
LSEWYTISDDLLRHVVPGALHVILRAQIEVDLVQGRLERREVPAPPGHRLGLVHLERLQAKLEHPLRLVLVRRDLAHHLFGQAGLRLEDRLVLGDEAVFVFVET